MKKIINSFLDYADDIVQLFRPLTRTRSLNGAAGLKDIVKHIPNQNLANQFCEDLHGMGFQILEAHRTYTEVRECLGVLTPYIIIKFLRLLRIRVESPKTTFALKCLGARC